MDFMRQLAELLDKLWYGLPALIGGMLDYLTQLSRGEKEWSFWTFFLHVITSIFFGWISGVAAIEAGYSGHAALAAAGFGGYLGARVGDLLYIAARARSRSE